LFGKNNDKSVYFVSNYCKIQPLLPESENVKKDIVTISKELSDYVLVSSSTRACECKETDEEKKKCWDKFLQLKK
jgi:hypothetical protein